MDEKVEIKLDVFGSEKVNKVRGASSLNIYDCKMAKSTLKQKYMSILNTETGRYFKKAPESIVLAKYVEIMKYLK